MKNAKITTTDVKKINRNRILQYIYSNEHASRQNIADKLQLSLPTVHQNLRLLESENLILLEGSYKSTGGRKAQVISVNPSARFTIAVNITDTSYKVSLINLRSQIVCSRTYMELCTQQNYVKHIIEAINDIINLSGISICEEDILGVGVTIPGIVDEVNAVAVNAPTMGVKNYSLKELAENIKYPCRIMNDARAAAYAQHWLSGEAFKKSQNSKDSSIMYLMLNDGVGGAIVSDNKIIAGKHNRMGEFGHMVIRPNGKKCFCGQNGCFECYVSARRLSKDLNISLNSFFSLVKDNQEYRYILEEYITNLAIGVNNLYIIYDSDVVIGGHVAGYLGEYKEILTQKLIDKCSFETDGSYVRLTSCSKEQEQMGAALTYIADFIFE
ncbi:MAG: ROK family transcriptional regulator [Lachnospira sp.]|nr:ROK family transcriptional regulator [Lachnospira sp.]